LKIETQCHERPKRPTYASTTINHLLLALYSEGEMTPYQIKQTLEGLTRYWGKVDRKDAELPMIEWEPEADDIFICSECNAMMYIQLLDELKQPKYCPNCRGVDTLNAAEPELNSMRPVLKIIPGGKVKEE
jgi:hypothetical protein